MPLPRLSPLSPLSPVASLSPGRERANDLARTSAHAAHASPRVVGRYAIYGEIGSGGMATVYFGRLRGAGGFSRPVAIKRLHPQFAKTPRFVDAFLDEARLAAQIRHPNVVPTLDVVAERGEILLVMEFIAGATLAELIELGGRIAPGIAASILAGALHGLHAAHHAEDDAGNALRIVHRDVSPHNVIVGTDGVTRVLDFGVAKAEQRLRTTTPGEVKGKLAYMAPEQIVLEQSTAQTDLYAAGVVLWEALTGTPLFRAENHGHLITKILSANVEKPSSRARAQGISPEFDAIVLRALERHPERRFETARDFARAIEELEGKASQRDVSEWVSATAGSLVQSRIEHAAMVERERSNAFGEVDNWRGAAGALRAGENTDVTSDFPADAIHARSVLGDARAAGVRHASAGRSTQHARDASNAPDADDTGVDLELPLRMGAEAACAPPSDHRAPALRWRRIGELVMVGAAAAALGAGGAIWAWTRGEGASEPERFESAQQQQQRQQQRDQEKRDRWSDEAGALRARRFEPGAEDNARLRSATTGGAAARGAAAAGGASADARRSLGGP